MKETIKRPLTKKPLNWRSLIWVFVAWLLIIYLFGGLMSPKSSEHTISYTKFKQLVTNGRVAEVTIEGNQISGQYRQTQAEKQQEKKQASAGQKSIFQIFQLIR